jgi:hypothetical protein
MEFEVLKNGQRFCLTPEPCNAILWDVLKKMDATEEEAEEVWDQLANEGYKHGNDVYTVRNFPYEGVTATE